MCLRYYVIVVCCQHECYSRDDAILIKSCLCLKATVQEGMQVFPDAGFQKFEIFNQNASSLPHTMIV